MKQIKSKRIYIIGNIPKKIDLTCSKRFSDIHVKLIKMGFIVTNPLEKLMTYKSMIEARKHNLQDLLTSDMVYIMPNTDYTTISTNVELKIAFQCDLTIITGLLKLDKKDKIAVDSLVFEKINEL